MSQPATYVEAERRLAADPASVVLLLAAPSAADLWPGLRLDETEPGDHIKVTVALPPEAADDAGVPAELGAVIRAEPPQRTPTAFVLRFTFHAADVARTEGALTLAYAPGDDDAPSSTSAHLAFEVAAPFAAASFVQALRTAARTFLDNLAAAAEDRSRAA